MPAIAKKQSDAADAQAGRPGRPRNVLHYGAECDGATDDRTAIQAALDDHSAARPATENLF
jgi:polygalacturonase